METVHPTITDDLREVVKRTALAAWEAYDEEGMSTVSFHCWDIKRNTLKCSVGGRYYVCVARDRKRGFIALLSKWFSNKVKWVIYVSPFLRIIPDQREIKNENYFGL